MTDRNSPSHRARRDSLLLLTDLRAEEDGRVLGSARVRNLSATGLMAECDAALAEGMRIHLTLRGVGEVAGMLSWVREGRIGLVFERPIDPMAARRRVGVGETGIANPYKAIGEPLTVIRFAKKPR